MGFVWLRTERKSLRKLLRFLYFAYDLLFVFALKTINANPVL